MQVRKYAYWDVDLKDFSSSKPVVYSRGKDYCERDETV